MPNMHEQLWQHVIRHSANGDVEETLDAIAVWLQHDCDANEDPTVKALLQSAADSCRSAAFEFYASTK
jgi:hypothetical protein